MLIWVQTMLILYTVCFQTKTNVTPTHVVMEGYARVPMTSMDLNVHAGKDTKGKVVKVMDTEAEPADKILPVIQIPSQKFFFRGD